MQASAFFVFAVCFQVSASTYSQTVSFTGKDVPLKTVFASVKKQTGFGIFFENGEAMLQSTAPVTLDLKNVPLELFLQVCLKDQQLDYSMEGATIFIKKKETVSAILVSASATTQVGEIKGRVTNDKGEPLVNANIVVKRTGHGTVTDANGNFTLRNIISDDVLSVSFIGYKTQTVPVKSGNSFTLVMEATTNELDKVVVQAYGTTTQRLATGNIGVVRTEDIAKQPVMNVLEALQGQVAGVSVTNTSGYASGTVKVEIRGRNTINPNFPSDPLYIIDGVPLTILDLYGHDSYQDGSTGVTQAGISSPATGQSGYGGQSPFFSINPADIESIEVLKDADATAIYGSRGANGVILISTKKGKAGKSHFDLSIYSGVLKTPKYYNMLTTSQYIAMRKEALANDGLPVDINNAPDLVVWDTIRYTNWQKYLWGGLGKTTDVEGSLSGGDARTTFRIAAGYHYGTEILTASGANKRGSLSFNITHKSLNQLLSIVFSGTYSIESSNLISVPGGIILPPNTPPVFDSKGNLNFAGWSPQNSSLATLGTFLQPYTAQTNFLNSGLVLSYQLPGNIQVKANLGYNNILSSQSQLIPIVSQDPSLSPNGEAFYGYSFIHNLIVEPQIEYNGFISKGKLNVLLGSSVQASSTTSASLIGVGYTNDALLTSITNAPQQSAQNAAAEYKYVAAFARINYNWKDKYILNLNARRDGSTRFGPSRQYGNFGSIGAAWIFTEEKWAKNIFSFFSFGKLRGSYGTTGGDLIPPYQYLSRWQYHQHTYNNTLPLIPLGLSNPLLQWQVNRKLEAAIDLGILDGKINLEAAWYHNECNNQLVAFPTPAFTGFIQVYANSPADVLNQGWEFLVNSKIIDNKDFKWNINFNIGINRNKLLAYPNLSQSPYNNQYVIGQPLSIIKVLHFTGVDPQTGLYTFQDRNKDGQITIDYSGHSDDRYILDLNPKYEGGFHTNLSFKNFELSIFLYFKKELGINAYHTLSAPGDNSNQPTSVLNRWQKPGEITNTAIFTTQPNSPSFYNFQQSDGIYTDASFMRMQNLSLTYSLGKNTLKKYGIGNFKLYIQCQNLFTITKYEGIDPEIQNFQGLPNPRILTTGVSCNF